MDAAQMLTAREIVRQCEQLARTVQQRENSSDNANVRHLRLVDPITEPIPVVAPPEEPEPDSPPPESGLTERDVAIMAFERQWWKHSGAKERAVRELFDMSPSRYYQLLNRLLDNPDAARMDPMLVKRLRRARESRQRARNARRLGIELR